MLIALHGFTETDLSWQESLTRLGSGVRCPLLPGHGWSACPDHCDLPQVAALLAEQLNPDGSDTLLGYSMGGRIALQIALEQPERVGRLILISCRPGIEDDAEREHRRQRDERLAEILEEDGIGPFVAWWERQPVLTAGHKLSSSMVQHLRSRRLNQDPIGLAAALRCFGQGNMAPLWSRLGELSMPVQLIVGDQDPAYHQAMSRMAELIPQAQLEVMAGCGHAMHREQPEQTTDLIENFIIDTAAKGAAS